MGDDGKWLPPMPLGPLLYGNLAFFGILALLVVRDCVA